LAHVELQRSPKVIRYAANCCTAAIFVSKLYDLADVGMLFAWFTDLH